MEAASAGPGARHVEWRTSIGAGREEVKAVRGCGCVSVYPLLGAKPFVEVMRQDQTARKRRQPRPVGKPSWPTPSGWRLRQTSCRQKKQHQEARLRSTPRRRVGLKWITGATRVDSCHLRPGFAVYDALFRRTRRADEHPNIATSTGTSSRSFRRLHTDPARFPRIELGHINAWR